MIGLTPRDLARALGGDMQVNGAVVPGPGHSGKDRSLSVTLSPGARDGFVVFSHAGDDPLACRDYVRGRLGLGPFKPGRQDGSKVVRFPVAKPEGRRLTKGGAGATDLV